ETVEIGGRGVNELISGKRAQGSVQTTVRRQTQQYEREWSRFDVGTAQGDRQEHIFQVSQRLPVSDRCIVHGLNGDGDLRGGRFQKPITDLEAETVVAIEVRIWRIKHIGGSTAQLAEPGKADDGESWVIAIRITSVEHDGQSGILVRADRL